MDVSIAIVTYQRERILLDTIQWVLSLEPLPREFIVVDQNESHSAQVDKELQELASIGKIRLFKRSPSIVGAMNFALAKATSRIVLFLDDDVIPSKGIVACHERSYLDEDVAAVVGQVLQPGESVDVGWRRKTQSGLEQDLDFRFCSCLKCDVASMIGCNMSVHREKAIAAGGFDENFILASYRFETEFARRLHRRNGRVVFCPEASVQHLKAQAGGTRSHGSHLGIASYRHSVGDYYFAMLEGKRIEAFRYCCRRFLTSALTRFHLKHPWYIPPKLIGELRGLLWAMQLKRQGQKLISHRE